MEVQQSGAADRVTLSIAPGEAIVSFVFDELPRSPSHDGGVILEHYGVRGTYLTDKDADKSWAGAIQQRGHELRESAGHDWVPGLNRGTVDVATLKANALSGADEVYRAALARIHEAAEGGWLVFHTRDVCEHPSPQGARALVFDFVVRTVIEAQLPVITIGAAIQHLSRR